MEENEQNVKVANFSNEDLISDGGVSLQQPHNDLFNSSPKDIEKKPLIESSNTTDEQHKNRKHLIEYYILWTMFFLQGTFNNFGYVVVIAAAKSLADHFNESNLIGVETCRLRGHCVALGFFVGYSLLAISVFIDFWFAIFAILIIGACSAIGESIMLGYLKSFPPKLAGAWSSGTGMAGLGGAGMYLLLSDVFGFSNLIIFICMVPTSFIYSISLELSWNSNIRSPQVYGISLNKKNNKLNEKLIIQMENKEENEREEEKLKIRLKRVFPLTWYRNTMLLLVYFFEYVISVGLAQLANAKAGRSHSKQNEYYAILALCYQLGVFISRSSISIIQLSQYGTMTILQCINFIVWHFHCKYNWFNPYTQFGLMIFVGLLGGAMYVNVVYSILDDKNILKKDRELSVNVMSLFVNVGITLSSAYVLFMDNTFFTSLVNKSD